MTSRIIIELGSDDRFWVHKSGKLTPFKSYGHAREYVDKVKHGHEVVDLVPADRRG